MNKKITKKYKKYSQCYGNFSIYKSKFSGILILASATAPAFCTFGHCSLVKKFMLANIKKALLHLWQELQTTEKKTETDKIEIDFFVKLLQHTFIFRGK